MPSHIIVSSQIRGTLAADNFRVTVTIQPGSLKGEITAPPSKSIAQRALAIALLRKGITVLRNSGSSADELDVLDLLLAAGCILKQKGQVLTVDSSHTSAVREINFGESGLATRMFTPLLALQDEEIRLTGTGSLLQRPMQMLEDALQQCGVKVNANKGFLPLTIKGPLQPKDILVDGSISSQTITGLIMAYSAAQANGVTIRVTNPVSKPYIALTLKVMEDMRMAVPKYDDTFTSFVFNGKPSYAGNLDYTIEGDWSGAAFLAVAGAIAGGISIKGLDAFTTQGDKAFLQPLMDAGATLSITMDGVTVRRAPLKAFHFDATDHPDLFPPLAVLGAFCSGTSVIEGVHRLIHKESNRAVTLQEELGKMGIAISFQDDLMFIKGGNTVTGATVDARGDHRIAMACAVAALHADGPTIIEGAGAVDKSWPSFFNDLAILGANITTS